MRLAHPKTRLQAITSRPKLLSAVGRLTRHAGRTRLLLTMTHEAAAQIKTLVLNMRTSLRHIQTNAPQLSKSHYWGSLVRYIITKILAFKPKPNLGLPALASG